MKADVSVIIPAAGLSLRMETKTRKPYKIIDKKPIIFHTLEKFYNLKRIKEIILVVNKKDLTSVVKKWSKKLKSYKVTKIISGGKRRQDSVYNGLCNLTSDTSIILIHDVVRPLVKNKTIKAVIKKVEDKGAAIVATPIKATVKKANPNLSITETVPRQNLWMAQTPQGFKREIITKSYNRIRKSNKEYTDDAEVVEKCGYTVEIVAGSDDNIKITTREDLKLAKSLLKKH